MLSLRLHLRTCTVLWLFCQTLSLAALVPTDCCAAHHVAAASASPECHQVPAAQAQADCPMHASAGDECPMHAASAGATSAAAASGLCAMRGLCTAPASALAMLIPVPGVLAVVPVVAQVESSVALVAIPASIVEHALTHDTPPPRA